MGRGRPKKRLRVPASAGEVVVEEEAVLLPVGAEVEVRSDDPGFVGSFYEATVVDHPTTSSGGDDSGEGRACRYAVVYSTLEGDRGEPLAETAAAADVRPRPPPVEQQQFAMYEMVEAFHNEGWWAGVVSAVVPRPPRVCYTVAFPTSREVFELEETALRPHRVFEGGRWVPAAAAHAAVDNVNPLLTEGNQVEVSGSTKFFGAFWNPATVLKVIGARNFLVQYEYVGKDGEPVTEILDSQYIRPVRDITRMDSKYRFSASPHVEVYHEGSWWPAVILEVLGSGVLKKYAVKLKSRETNMEDVECVEVLKVENTQLRPRFDWHDRKWVRYSTEKPHKRSQLMSRKRRISASSGLYYNGDKIRNKRSKITDVSEPVSALSVCNANDKMKHKYSSYPEETPKKENAVLALGSPFSLPSLPPMAGFGHLGDSSLVPGSHLERSPSQIIIVSPVLRCAQLQASLFGAFGQPRPLPHGPVFGMQSLNPDHGGIEGSRQYQKKQSTDEGSYLMESTDEQNINVGTGTDLSRKTEELVSFQTQGNSAIAKTGIAAETITTISNIVANSEHSAKLTHDDDVIELSNDATPGCEVHSEVNTVSHIDPTPLKYIEGSQERSEVEDLQQGSYTGEAEHGSTEDIVMIENSMLSVTSPTLGNSSDVNMFSSESTTQYASKMTKSDKRAISVEQNIGEEFCQGTLVAVHNAKVHSLPSEKSSLGTSHDQLSEPLAIQPLPFAKTSPFWAQIESMEIFNKVPQHPNFHQLEQQQQQQCPELREGMALGLMFSFANLAESIDRLSAADADDYESFEEKRKGLDTLELHGFDVTSPRSRLETLLHIKKTQAALDKLEEEIGRRETDDGLLGTQIQMLAVVVSHLELHSGLLRGVLRSAVSRKMNNAVEIAGLRTEALELERSCSGLI